MSRPLRIEYPDAYYHVMNRGQARQSIFHGDAYYASFLKTLAEAYDRFGLEIHAYCLMSNHYHLLVKTPQANLQRAMRHMGGVYTQRYNRLKKRDGPLFRGRYKAILVDSDAYLLHLSRYIHRNPLEARMIDDLAHYPWSSYPNYIGKAPSPPWLCMQEVYGQLNTKRQVKKKYQDFVLNGETDERLTDFYGKRRLKPILGDDDFVAKCQAEYDDIDQEISHDDIRSLRPSLDLILTTVGTAYNVDRETLIKAQKGRGKSNLPRKVAMHLAQRQGGYRLTEIARVFGLKHYGGVSSAVYRIEKALESDKSLNKMIKDIIKRFDP